MEWDSWCEWDVRMAEFDGIEIMRYLGWNRWLDVIDGLKMVG